MHRCGTCCRTKDLVSFTSYGGQGLGLGKVHGSKEAQSIWGLMKEIVKVEGKGTH